MNTADRRSTAQIESIIRRLDNGTFQSCTSATGVASAPRLATAAIEGLWLFLGVEVDPAGLRPQPVRLLEVPVEGQLVHALIVEDGRRLLAYSQNGRNDIVDQLDRTNIVIEWTPEVGLVS